MSEQTNRFAQSVVARTMGVDFSQVESCCSTYESTGMVGAIGINPAALLAMVQAAIKAIMDLISNCPSNARRPDFSATVKRPGLFHRARLSLVVSRACRDCSVNDSDIRGYSSRLAENIRIAAADLTEAEIAAIVSEVSED